MWKEINCLELTHLPFLHYVLFDPERKYMQNNETKRTKTNQKQNQNEPKTNQKRTKTNQNETKRTKNEPK